MATPVTADVGTVAQVGTGTKSRSSSRARLGPIRRSARVRILGWYVVMMVVAIGASLLIQRQVLLLRLRHRVDAQLTVDAAALSRQAQLAGGPSRSVPALFNSYLHSHLAGPNSEFLTLVNGRPYQVSPNGNYPLDRVSGLMRMAASAHHVLEGDLSTPAGSIHYLAVPVAQPGSPSGTFVAATFNQPFLQEVNGDVAVAGAVSLTILLVMSLIAWWVAGRVLAPVRVMTDAALTISETDLTRRIPDSGSDEIGALAGAFNSMLDRLQGAFLSQRDFVSDAGHELRTPITVIRGHLELLGDSPEERVETMAIVNDELDRMSRMVDDLLLLAKAERPGFLRLEPVDINELVHDLMAKLTTLGPRAWSSKTAGSVKTMADRQRLTQAIMNLAENAVAHTSEGDPIILGMAADKTTYRMWVSDTGIGIAQEDQARIFDRFARGRNQRRRSQGSGLGLAIVRAIAEAHRGRVELSSAPGRGSTFTLVLGRQEIPEEWK